LWESAGSVGFAESTASFAETSSTKHQRNFKHQAPKGSVIEGVAVGVKMLDFTQD
jgi:hypothetical protein